MQRYAVWLFLTALAAGCKTGTANHQQKAIEEIRQAEAAFSQRVREKGIAAGFGDFADSSAVIKRENDSLITGPAGIRRYYSQPYFQRATVEWSPDFTDASPDGRMGYTYGRYTWVHTDSSGRKTESRGVFHTVWKKQKDGTWRYVWD